MVIGVETGMALALAKAIPHTERKKEKTNFLTPQPYPTASIARSQQQWYQPNHVCF